jgi:hypothetical protein
MTKPLNPSRSRKLHQWMAYASEAGLSLVYPARQPDGTIRNTRITRPKAATLHLLFKKGKDGLYPDPVLSSGGLVAEPRAGGPGRKPIGDGPLIAVGTIYATMREIDAVGKRNIMNAAKGAVKELIDSQMK